MFAQPVREVLLAPRPGSFLRLPRLLGQRPQASSAAQRLHQGTAEAGVVEQPVDVGSTHLTPATDRAVLDHLTARLTVQAQPRLASFAANARSLMHLVADHRTPKTKPLRGSYLRLHSEKDF